METPWGNLKELNLADSELCAAILAQDKHQLAEGLVVENLFDQIIEAVPKVLTGAIALDIETAIVDTRRAVDRWQAFVWARSRGPGLGRFLTALERRFRTWLIDLDGDAGIFTVREWKDGDLAGERRPLPIVMSELSGRRPQQTQVSIAVRDEKRQKSSFWGFLNDTYGERLGPQVILPRLFINYAIQPWFRAVWNLDRILIHGNDIWLLEIKHKFPFGRRELRFGINNGELGVIRRLGEAGIRCFHAILAKPSWTKESGSAYLLNRLSLRERTALIGVELDGKRLARMFGARQGISPEHTTFSGTGELRFRSLAATDFGKIGVMSELHGQLAMKLGSALAGSQLAPVTDNWLRDLKAD